MIELKAKSSDNYIYQAIGQLCYYLSFYPDRNGKIVAPIEPSLKMIEVCGFMDISIEVFECTMNYL